MSLLESIPPDNTGSETVDRFRYQAQLAISYCLECACGGKVKSVILEHFEDIVVEYEDEWFFAQVKTRDEGQPYWRVSTAVNGLKSLYRSFEVTKHLSAKYALLLEGGIAGNDSLAELAPGGEPPSEKLKDSIKKALGISDKDCAEFLSRTLVHAHQPPRATIDAYTKDLLGKSAEQVSQPELTAIKDRLTDELLAAMAEARLDSAIPSFIQNPESLGQTVLERVTRKRFTVDRLKPFLNTVIMGPSPLLKRIADLNVPPPTNLEKKLLAAGASEAIVRNAKRLRANAMQRAYEITTAGLFDDTVLDDVRYRIESIAVGIPSAEQSVEATWVRLQDVLRNQADSVDPRRVYHRDVFLLVGAACELSDECLFDWGVPLA